MVSADVHPMDNVWNAAEDRRVRKKGGLYVMLAVVVFFIIVSVMTREWGNFLLSLPTFVILIAIVMRGRYLFIPPLLVAIMAAMMILLQLARFGSSDMRFLDVAADFMMGVFMSLIGLIGVYTMMRASPGFDTERSLFVSMMAASVGFSLCTMMVMGDYAMRNLMGDTYVNLVEDLMIQLSVALCGILFMTLLFYLNRHNGLFEHTLNRFLRENSSGLGIDEQERKKALEDIAGGETNTREFKSTLRTNLQTGEKDPRMEKAVLKTIVAFLNSRGGTLFIGVADDGSVIGIDEDSFESRDRMNLHMNNLIVSQIGSEYLPYINYKLIDFDGKAVMRVDCKKSNTPAFHKEKDKMVFYVRSGPSSIVLEGMQLLYYASHNFPKLPTNSAGNLFETLKP